MVCSYHGPGHFFCARVPVRSKRFRIGPCRAGTFQGSSISAVSAWRWPYRIFGNSNPWPTLHDGPAVWDFLMRARHTSQPCSGAQKTFVVADIGIYFRGPWFSLPRAFPVNGGERCIRATIFFVQLDSAFEVGDRFRVVIGREAAVMLPTLQGRHHKLVGLLFSRGWPASWRQG
jgi:hypothetical protein